jgi:hypothetical protein
MRRGKKAGWWLGLVRMRDAEMGTEGCLCLMKYHDGLLLLMTCCSLYLLLNGHILTLLCLEARTRLAQNVMRLWMVRTGRVNVGRGVWTVESGVVNNPRFVYSEMGWKSRPYLKLGDWKIR